MTAAAAAAPVANRVGVVVARCERRCAIQLWRGGGGERVAAARNSRECSFEQWTGAMTRSSCDRFWRAIAQPLARSDVFQARTCSDDASGGVGDIDGDDFPPPSKFPLLACPPPKLPSKLPRSPDLKRKYSYRKSEN